MDDTAHGELLTITEAAAQLNVSRVTVYRRVWDGSLPAVRLGYGQHALRIPANELTDFIYGEAERTTAK